jgi:hypothetical protein
MDVLVGTDFFTVEVLTHDHEQFSLRTPGWRCPGSLVSGRVAQAFQSLYRSFEFAAFIPELLNNFGDIHGVILAF